MALLPAVNAFRPAASAVRRKGGCYSWTLLDANSSLVRVRSHRMDRCSTMASRREKMVWVWTESTQVMTAAVERSWNSFVFPGSSRDLAQEWSLLWFFPPINRNDAPVPITQLDCVIFLE
ncbi:hypothetical protein Taro_022231 [Colocasia esculenta]|uniref:Uncharacterized protein n=1 Tax=Colocasia esculenta TaxID=4460 RepID=A0A843V7T2_COLES|nr:hypothetical protein [Colocasia esculenta]